jgi:acetoin utilization protein AcuC
VTCSVTLPWDDGLIGYDFGGGHPLNPIRVELTMSLAASLGVLDRPQLRRVGCSPATDAALTRIHDPAYLDTVRRCEQELVADVAHGLGTPDNPIFAGMHEASSLVAGASLAAASAVLAGDSDHGVNVAGGLHHAMHATASGFCVYNDPAIAIAWLLDQGIERIGYVDIDVHHGDGVQAAFWDDPRVMTISLHETGRMLFPGTGFAEETGGDSAPGTAVNVALPPGTGDDDWLRAFDAVVPPLLRAYAPQLLLTQHGCDAHALDPLAHLMLSVDGQREAAARLHRLSHELCDGRWVAVGGGGYELVRVVPRTWTHLLAEATGDPIAASTSTPQEWQDVVRRRTTTPPPTQMTDGRQPDPVAWDGPRAGDALDAAVAATRAAVFGLHGLDPAVAA